MPPADARTRLLISGVDPNTSAGVIMTRPNYKARGANQRGVGA